jgi:hypothetical protein
MNPFEIFIVYVSWEGGGIYFFRRVFLGEASAPVIASAAALAIRRTFAARSNPMPEV